MRSNAKQILMASAALIALACQGAKAQDAVELSVVHGSPNGHVISAQGVDVWMACMEEAGVSDVTFRYYPAGQLSATPELLNSLNSGIADLAPVPIGYVTDKMPLNGVSMLPGLGSTATEIITAYSEAVKEGPLAEEFASNNIKPLWVMAFPPYQMVSMDGPIRSESDFQGKVIRSAGGSMNLAIQSLGASPAEIPVGDMYVALERGTADGTISALSSLKPFNVHELMGATSTNGAFGTFSNVFSIRTDRWEALSPETQQAMTECGAKTEESVAAFMDEEAVQLAEEFAELGAEVYEFTEEEMGAINEKLAPVSEDWVSRLSDRGLPAEEVFADYSARLGAE
ncbi:TRAP transporter substrate-binding protein [Pararhizobium haloflavum]|uniref:TRAP transporter substrate-binding protein n=1 Tax=Pararhizobium haloflavum TaxID=2037914 RepID=UPI0018E49C6A|nr:TRAP transporter substrate-binding protein DctP [Pararhizobium haloflavum]